MALGMQVKFQGKAEIEEALSRRVASEEGAWERIKHLGEGA